MIAHGDARYRAARSQAATEEGPINMADKDRLNRGYEAMEPEQSGAHLGKVPPRPIVGQSRPYDSGSNAHKRHEKPREEPRGAKRMPLGGRARMSGDARD